MENKYLIGVGLLVLGVFAYSTYNKKDESGQGEEQGGGGGIGGGGFGGGAFVSPTSPTSPTTPTPVAKTSAGIQPIKITNPTVLAGLGAGKPVSAPIGSKNLSNSGIGVANTGGITGIPGVKTSSASTTSSGMGSVSGVGIQNVSTPPTMTGTAGGTVFKPFSGGESNGKTPIYLNDLVRSWNRP
jgi:hypothetical protein